MKKSKTQGLMLVGSLRSAGVTTYLRQGKIITRVSNSHEKRSNTLLQFIQRQKMRHAISLWSMLKYCKPMFTGRQTAYLNFTSLASRLPAVYVTRPRMEQSSFLMPGIPMSDGTLPVINERLGEVDGMPALLTDLKADKWSYRTELWLYSGEQRDADSMPRVWFSKRQVSWDEMTLVDGCYALKDPCFADDMKGWVLVMVKGERCSSQALVTRCTLYEKYMTDEALEAAADSYGGLTNPGILSGG
ncbi:MAG: hypothetical protein IJG07_03810 [Prevotella sp.]|nr:hypothetical protein [Prevotella sp.]